MANRILGNLVAVTSFDPITTAPESMTLIQCLPVDYDGDGLPIDTRFVSLVLVPLGVFSVDLLPLFERERAFSAQQLTYVWEVAA